MTDINSIIDRIKAGETGRDIGAAALYAAGSTELAGGPAFFDRETGDAHFFDAEQMLTSMDACLALMERVLPGWIGDVTTTGLAWVMSDQEQFYGDADGNPAAALLIAILKAVKAESEAA